jgi:Tol biopolymer transport system component
MGEVYKARDTRLERTVAVKVLATHLTATPELKQRFEREARAISSLNHPHICQLYDVGLQDGTDFLVMEFLEGETLAERVRKGPIAVAELLRTGAEVAEALEVAHRAGIVHRDLKPGNIMLTKAGAKLMDFGLAKPAALGAAASGTAPLLSAARTASGASPMSPLTTAGSIVGTIQYMSPEQIEGKDADARSDVFALGAVIYEMATGKRAFEGKSQISVASAILEKEPEAISSVQPLTPPALEHVVTRAIAKNPDERWQSAADVAGELRWIAANPSSGKISLPAMAAPKRYRELWAWMPAAVLVMAAIVFAAFYFLREPAPGFAIRSEIPAPKDTNFVFLGDNGGPAVLSPDGKALAFVASDATGGQRLYVRPLDSLESRVLSGTENAWAPFWSPDGRKIGFFADSKVKVIDAQGGAPIAIAEAPNARGGSWSKNGNIIYAPDYRSPLMIVPASGGTPRQITKLDEATQTSHRWPFFLPDGKHFLYLAVSHESPQTSAIFFASLDGKQNTRVTSSLTQPEYANGELLYVRESELVAQSFDPSSGKLQDDAQQVVSGVTNDGTTWRAMYTVSANGILAYSGAAANRDTQLGWFDRSGKPLGTIGDKVTILTGAALSPRADRVVLSIDTGNNNLWVLDIARNVRTRLTFGTGDISPVWSPDGKWIGYESVTKYGFDIVRRPADGGAEEVLLPENPVTANPSQWSRDGKYILYIKGAVGTYTECWALPLFGDRKPFLLVPAGKHQCNSPMLSPNGKWLAYNSDESGRFEIYAVPFGRNGGRWQVSTAGGVTPEWRGDGKELFYSALNGMLMAVTVAEQANEIKLGAPRALFQLPSIGFSAGAQGGPNIYDAAASGQKFMTATATNRSSQPLTLVVNWTADLKKQ